MPDHQRNMTETVWHRPDGIVMPRDLLGLYEHYEGGHYRVVAVAWHAETNEEMVVYHLNEDLAELYVCSVGHFFERVEPDVRRPRFVWTGER